jgi:Flp pilus assembly protein TadB
MPVVIFFALLAVDAELMRPFVRDPLGITLCALAAVLVGAGGLTIRRIIRIDV